MAAAMLVGAVAWATFANSIGNGFAWDDRGAILTNADVHSDVTPLSNLLWHDFWGGDMHSPISHKSFRPLTVLSFRCNYAISGLTPWSFHATNVALHAIASMLVVVVGQRLQRSSRVPVLGGLLFAVHPIHCDSVASIVGRADILATVFSLAAILAYVPRAAKATPTPRHVASAMFWTLCATLCKENGATTFGILLVLECARAHEASPRRLAALTGTLVLLVCVRVALNGRHTLYVWSKYENEFATMQWGVSKWLTIAHLHGWYLFKLLWPQHLCYDYGYQTLPVLDSILDARNGLTLAAYAALACVLVCAIRSPWPSPLRAYVALGVCPFVPAANVLFPVGTVLAERLLYFPSVGFCLVLGLILDAATGVARAVSRNRDWHSEHSLFASALTVSPSSVKVLTNVAKELLASDPPRAAMYLERAVMLLPTYSLAHLNLAAAYGKYDAAFGKPLHSMHHLIQSCELDRSSLAYASLGLRLVEFVARHGDAIPAARRRNILEKAESFVWDAIAVTPLVPSAYYTLGLAAYYRDAYDEALQYVATGPIFWS
ncbi:hypothetical protein SPRG_09933 [Saprolegnia parasitica CBS 223.65]|uniref:DUF1736 domain-containing protein n=1 Tax=Saprolegnia parasitica (strain CBS 223.65) TaxID=695850 RepID=A0A067CCN4_SAPPC|nr:hypothetical protein SPRG_09933 [Saprolegnia parasitica CBS 223.65]KDO24296.1 hypothetical protein SPRG_09933 [Saprolegnia parasitica CBS 223.65]|eukprot:XP_012205066.1 hypothetical protein SPRG_09933 [Saprolegnia parasitica CBS 223.65]